MRTVHIDFLNTENQLPDGNILGNQGEHNATVLAVTPPAEMTANENITSYRIAFELSNCRAVHSKDIAKADVISLPLFSQITSSETVAVQLEGYDGNGEIIIKSPKIKKLKFNPSVCGVEIPPSDSPNSMAAEVTANTLFRNKFSENENGNLLYNGKSLAERPYKTFIVNQSDTYSISSNLNTGVFVFGLNVPDDAVNADVKRVRIKLSGYAEWIDIDDISLLSLQYIATIKRKLSFINDYSGYLLLGLDSITSQNDIINNIAVSNYSQIEIEYYI